MRDEVINGATFHSATKVRVVVNGWLEHYNQVRPHRAIGMAIPAVFAPRRQLVIGRSAPIQDETIITTQAATAA